MSIRSMTGFARSRRNSELGEVIATVKSVNHRALDLHSHLPSELEPFEPALRQLVKTHLKRGHIDLRLSFIPAHTTATHALNRPLFEAYLQSLDEIQTAYKIPTLPDPNAALRIPGMLAPPRDEDTPQALESEVMAAVAEALETLNSFRDREGGEIAELMRGHCRNVQRDADEIAQLRTQVNEVLQTRMRDRLAELLNGSNLDPQRLAQEAAVLADRSDITEELGRLQVHARELLELLTQGGEIGKKLDFLLQEMGRETNTVLSKTSAAGELGLRITALGLETKANIERIREQALNVE